MRLGSIGGTLERQGIRGWRHESRDSCRMSCQSRRVQNTSNSEATAVHRLAAISSAALSTSSLMRDEHWKQQYHSVLVYNQPHFKAHKLYAWGVGWHPCWWVSVVKLLVIYRLSVCSLLFTPSSSFLPFFPFSLRPISSHFLYSHGISISSESYSKARPLNDILVHFGRKKVLSIRAIALCISTHIKKNNFYRAAWNADAVLRWDFRPSVRPSVRLSVKRVHCDKTESSSTNFIATQVLNKTLGPLKKDMFRFLYYTKDDLA